MKVYVLYFIVVIMISTSPARAGDREVKVISNPSRVKVEVYGIASPHDFEVLDKCKTPCILKFHVDESKEYSYNVSFRKKGYVSERDIELDLEQAGLLSISQNLKSKKIAEQEWEAKQLAESKAARATYLAKKEREVASCNQRIENPTITNRPLESCRRKLPLVPSSFSRGKFSGYCDVEFNIKVDGRTEFVETICTDPILVEPTLKAIQDWIYVPLRVKGKNVRTNQVKFRVKFIVNDDAYEPYPFPQEE